MGEIYSSAVDVIVWLGKPNVYFEDFLWVVTVLLPRLEELADNSDWEEVEKSKYVDPRFIQRVGLNIPDRRLLGYGLFHNTNWWFVRSWIVQEVANARDIRILCGSTEIPWRAVASMSDFARRSYWIRNVRHRHLRDSNGENVPLEVLGHRLNNMRGVFAAAKCQNYHRVWLNS